MHSNAEHARSRMLFASVLRLLFALLVSVYSTSVWASGSPDSHEKGASGTADGEFERPLCGLADISAARAPGSCEPTQAEAAVSVAVDQLLLARPSHPTLSLEALSLEALSLEALSLEALSLEALSLEEGSVPEPVADPEVAPMCDLSAASIAATVEIPPQIPSERDRARLEPLLCDQQRLLSLLRSDDRERCAQLIGGEQSQPGAPPPAPSRADRSDGACALSVQLAWPGRAAASVLAVAVHRGLAWQPGHVSRLYRPPSPRA